MARKSSFRVQIDTADVLQAADRLDSVTVQTLGRTTLAAVNQVAQQGYASARKKMIAGINLSDDYLQQRMQFEPATNAQRPVAYVVARGRNTTLGSYGGRQMMQPVRFPNGSFVPGALGKNPRKPGALLPWKERKGDPLRGIPVNQKQAGLSVEVTRGRRKTISYAFVIPKNGVMLSVKRVRGTRNKVEPLYGPSVYQLFRASLSDDFLRALADDLSTTVLDLTYEELAKALR